MMSHCISEPDILMQLWPNILLGWMSFSFYCDIQEYDNSVRHVLKLCTAMNLTSQVAMTSCSPLLNFQNMLLHGLLITFWEWMIDWMQQTAR